MRLVAHPHVEGKMSEGIVIFLFQLVAPSVLPSNLPPNNTTLHLAKEEGIRSGTTAAKFTCSSLMPRTPEGQD